MKYSELLNKIMFMFNNRNWKTLCFQWFDGIEYYTIGKKAAFVQFGKNVYAEIGWANRGGNGP